MKSSPVRRPLKISSSSDPMIGTTAPRRISIDVNNEMLKACPAGERLEVIDYDGAHDHFYEPVNLNDDTILMQGGLDPTESDPRFHQQMVYAVASKTLENFDIPLGRRLTLGTTSRPKLRLFPPRFTGRTRSTRPICTRSSSATSAPIARSRTEHARQNIFT